MHNNQKHCIKMDRFSNVLLMWVERVGLLLVTVATFVSLAHELSRIWLSGTVGLGDLLQLFLYLEVFSMINSYFGSGKIPMRYPIYIAIVALARYILLDMKEMTDQHMLSLSFSILILALAVLVMRFGHAKYPYDDVPDLPHGKARDE